MRRLLFNNNAGLSPLLRLSPSKYFSSTSRPNKLSSNEALEILGLRKNPTRDEINAAYRKRAMQAHPDTASNKNINSEKFMRIVLAKECLLIEPFKNSSDRIGEERGCS